MVSAFITFLGFSVRLNIYLNTSGNENVFKFQIAENGDYTLVSGMYANACWVGD